MRALVIILSVALLSVVAPGALADDPHGGDAPNDWFDAWTVPPGTYSGKVDGNYDWYRLEVPSGKLAQVAYTTLPSDTWNDLHFLEDDGTYIGSVKAREGMRFVGLDTGAIRIGVDGFWDPMEYTLQLSLVDRSPQDDAGLGQDAPNHWKFAADVVAGAEVTGFLDDGFKDPGDWLRINVPADQWLSLHTEIPSGATSVEVRDDEGSTLASAWVFGGSTFRVATETGAVRFGLPSTYEQESWQFTTTLHDRPDLVVSDVQIEERLVQVGGQDLPLSLQRTVSVAVNNAGQGPAVDGRLKAWVTHPHDPSPRARTIYDDVLQIGGMSETTVRFDWDTTGELGAAVLHVAVESLFDLVPEDNEVQIQAAVLVSGGSQGVDLLNHRQERNVKTGGLSNLFTQTEVRYDTNEHGLYFQGERPARGQTALVHAGTQQQGPPFLKARVCDGGSCYGVD